MPDTRVKICCIASLREAHLAIDAGAWALGLVSEMPSGPGPIADELIAEIAAAVRGEVETFLLTSRTDAVAIVDHHEHCRTTTLQLVDHVPHEDLRRVRAALHGVRLVQVIHVQARDSVAEARRVAPLVDMILLDSGQPGAPTPSLGGTGSTHDWALSRQIRDAVEVPVFLAGGLHPGNVREAIGRVRPCGVDLCSGIRHAGRLDPDRLEAFFASVRATTPGSYR